MKTIQTTWERVFEKSKLILFNEYPNILNRLGEYDELAQFYPESEDETDNEIFQWYLVDGFTAEWLERFCPSIYEDVHWSDTMGNYVLAVRHFGTGWDGVRTQLEIKDEDEDMFDLYKKYYYDDLPDWAKKDIL